MKPPIIPSYDQAHNDLGTTIGRLFSAFTAAVNEAREYTELKQQKDRSFFSHHVRYLAKMELANDYAPEDADLEDTANSGICLVLPGYRVRVLRATEDGEIPDPGQSVRRQRFLAQQSEQQYSFDAMWRETEEMSAPESTDQREPAHIVVMWDTDQSSRFSGLWFICPNGTSEPYFKRWLATPDGGDIGLPDLPKAPPNTPPQAPPADVGYTKKYSKPEAPQKTGTHKEE